MYKLVQYYAQRLTRFDLDQHKNKTVIIMV